jgi:hypothetical protein
VAALHQPAFHRVKIIATPCILLFRQTKYLEVRPLPWLKKYRGNLYILTSFLK